MKIEVGKQYQISNKFKKSYVEKEFLKNYDTGDVVIIEQGWRQGIWFVTPQNAEEVQMLTEAQQDGFCDELCITDFIETEMIESWDGCWDDWDWSGYKSKEGDELEDFQDEVYEEGMFYLLDNGFDSDDCECFFQGQLTIVEDDSSYKE